MSNLQYMDNNQSSATKTFIVEDIDGNQIQIALAHFYLTTKKEISFNIVIERYDVIEKNLDAFQSQINLFFQECREKAMNAGMPFIYNVVDTLPVTLPNVDE